MLSMVMSTMYGGEVSPPQGSAQAIASIFDGMGLSPVNDGGRRPPVRSFHLIICVAEVPVKVMAFDPLAQVPSYSVAAGAQAPQVARPSAVWRLSTS